MMSLQARSLENQIDVKLISLSKLGTSLRSGPEFGDSRTPLLSAEESTDNGASSVEQFKALSTEIEGLLNQLATVNTSLSEWADRQAPSAAVHHTVQRHRDIYQDYKQEFTKTRSNLTALIQRHDLLSGGGDKGKSNSSGDSSSLRMDMLLKESEHARNSERLIDDQINIAIEARDSLVNQRVAFKAIQTKLNDISNRFPMINNLVQKINLRKRRDAIIVACVIGLCLTFLLWWMFS